MGKVVKGMTGELNGVLNDLVNLYFDPSSLPQLSNTQLRDKCFQSTYVGG